MTQGQLSFTFDDSSAVRTRRAKTQSQAPQLTMFAFAANIDVHLHSPVEAVAQLSGSDVDRAVNWLESIVGSLHHISSRRVAFASIHLDRLLAVRPPAVVTLDAASSAVARALWAHSMGLRPLKVTRHRQRLLAASPRWPTGLGVVDAPWPSIATLLHYKIPLDIDQKAQVLMQKKMAETNQHIARAWLAGSAVMIETAQPELVEGLGLPALAYAGSPDSGRYRLPLLAASQVLEEPIIEVPADLATAIKKANQKTRPLSSLEGFPWELYPFQARDAATALRIVETAGGVLLAGDMGSGKGLPAGTPVQTPTGPVDVASLVPGDLVLGSDGQSHRVTGTYPQGLQDLYEVTFSDHTKILTDAAHLWQVHSPAMKYRDTSGSDYPEVKVLSTKELLDTPLRDATGLARWYIPLVSAPLEFETPTPPLPGYVLGALLGDGSFVEGPPRPTDHTKEVLAHVEVELRDHPEFLSMKVSKVARIEYNLVSTATKNPLTAELRRLGLLGLRSFEKFVPDCYKYAPSDVRLAVLQGLLDTDGGVASRRSLSSIEFTSTSERLVDDVTWLVQSLGGTARKSSPRQAIYTSNGTKRRGRPSWRLSIALPTSVAPFRIATKATLYQPRTKYLPTRGIVSVAPAGRAETYCIAVDAPDSLYVTDHAIVTHNTTVALALVQTLELWPLLVVCPLAAMSTWARQLGQMGRNYYLASESPAVSWQKIESGGYEAIVISYDRLHAFMEVIEHVGFAAIVADELQRIRTPSSRRSRALRALAQTVPVRIGLSGTPLQNRIDDLLAPASFLVPGEFKPRATAKDLSDLYPGDPIEAIAEHVGTLMVRRRMEDTGVKLPNKSVRRLYVDLTAEQRHALQTLESEAAHEAEDGALDRMHAFVKLQKMRQIISCPSVANVGGVSPKVEAAIELVEEFVAMDRKCVIFCANRKTWTDLADSLKRLGIGYTGIWGSTPIKERIANEQRFHQDPDTKVFIGTIQSCAESLTLSPTGTVVIHCDYVYNPSDLAQAEARVYRMNQTNPVDVIYLHAASHGGTLDDRMAEILDVKRALFAKVIDRTEYENTAEVSYSLGDLVFLLTGSRDEKIDQREQDRKAVAKREQDLKRHARVTLYKNKGKNRYSDDFFDDGSTAILLEDHREANPAAHPDELDLVEDDLLFESDPEDTFEDDEDFDVLEEDEDQ